MISLQNKFFEPTRVVDARAWFDILKDNNIAARIARIRELRKQGQNKEADAEKRKLPAVCYQATFDETLSKTGIKGAWRKQSAARLNGLFMLDIDHMEEKPSEWFRNLAATNGDTRKEWCEKNGIVLVHVTSSGNGLRFVAIADPAIGNISDNQHALASKLGVVCDEACKDASRLSFVPTWDDVIFENNEKLLNYENSEFDKKFGEEYRSGRSSATRRSSIISSLSSEYPSASAGKADDEGRGQNDGVDEQDNGQMSGTPSVLELEYHGATYGKIIECWLDANAAGWRDAAAGKNNCLDGQRHRLLLKMASDLRYVCDKKDVFTSLVKESALGKMLRAEGEEEEVLRVADDSLRYRLWREIPQRLRPILERAGVRQHDDGHGAGTKKIGIDYEAWWRRLQPLLDESPYLRDACEMLPPHHRMAGVLASGAMFGTYLSRCWWEHFDGKTYRLSFLVYIIGDAASGKSAIVDLDRLIMAPMIASDKVGREWERQYKEEMKMRNASSKNAKEAAPSLQHPVIRYLPSTISNAMLYRRLTDAIDKECLDAYGDQLHLHCYTFEAELATALRAQQGSWAGKLDLECKSFQNEVAGVDYANDDSSNGIIEINWNQVVTGTPDALRRKIRRSTVTDGLVTRLAVFPMPSNNYAMIERRPRIIQNDRDCRLRAVGIDLETISGELACKKLVDYCYEYEAKLTKEAEMNEDLCLDYFRKRIPLIMVRYTLVRAVLRQIKDLQKGKELQIIDSDLEFAKLIGDFTLEMQMYMFGNELIDAKNAQDIAFTPRRRSNKVMERFYQLEHTFTRDNLASLMPESKQSAITMAISGWLKDGLIKRVGENSYEKLVNDIS